LTHKEATKGDRCGWASECEGELAHHGDYPDVDYRTLPPTGRKVTVHFCLACGHVLSSSGGELLNVYRPPDAGRMAGELAANLDVAKLTRGNGSR
jgi:hypothetical protein